MAEMIGSYEAVLIFSVKAGEEAAKNLQEKFKKLIEENATLKNVDDWGKRRFAYPIEKETDGYYMLFDFESNPSFPAELSRVCNITDGLVRAMTIKKGA